jgi:hypothetical protein
MRPANFFACVLVTCPIISYLEVTKDELENIALESTRTIEVDEFVPRKISMISPGAALLHRSRWLLPSNRLVGCLGSGCAVQGVSISLLLAAFDLVRTLKIGRRENR